MKGRCPKDSALIALFMNQAPPREAGRLLRHLASCARCTLRFNVLRQVKRELQPQVDRFVNTHDSAEGRSLLRHAAESQLQIHASKPSRASSVSRLRPFGLLASFRFAMGFFALIMVVATGAFILLSRHSSRSELRSPSPALNLLAPLGRIASSPTVFRWTPVLHAEDYFIELIDDGLARLHVGSTFLITEAVVPQEVRSRLVKGQTYVWSVSARDANGDLLMVRSGSFTIE